VSGPARTLGLAAHEAVLDALLATATETRTRAGLVAEQALRVVLALVADGLDHDAATTSEARRRTILRDVARQVRAGTLPLSGGPV